MRIVLAGGGGFVGSHLAWHLLASGHKVTIVDNFMTGRRANVAALRKQYPGPRLHVCEADICRPLEVAEKIHAVLHLASPASPVDYMRHPLQTLEAGSTGTRYLLELAHRHGARFLLASTSEVYGDPDVHPQPESYWGCVNPVGPRSVYDEAKRYAEALTSAYARTYGVPVRIARIFNTYGPRMRLEDGRVIPSLVRQALLGEPLTVFGDGTQTRSYCYVDDLIAGLEALLWSNVEGPVNLGNPEEYTVLETARIIVELLESKSSIVFRQLPPDDPRRRRPDISRARELLGWSPRIPLREGLSPTVGDLARRLAQGDEKVLSEDVEATRSGGARRARRPESTRMPSPGAAEGLS